MRESANSQWREEMMRELLGELLFSFFCSQAKTFYFTSSLLDTTILYTMKDRAEGVRGRGGEAYDSKFCSEL